MCVSSSGEVLHSGVGFGRLVVCSACLNIVECMLSDGSIAILLCEIVSWCVQ